MKIPVEWLSEYVDLKGISDAQLSDALTMSGTENEIVKGVDFPNIVVGEIKEITDHPDADRLHITKVDVGFAGSVIPSKAEESLKKSEKGSLHSSKGSVEMTKNQYLQIVCGAPNIEVGQKVPVALVGAMIGEFEIKKAKIRGVESNGMLCSESELGISEDHSGIMILDPRAKVGAPLSSALNIGGTVLEAEITPNRSDCFSMVGIAGEAAAALNRKMKNRNFSRAEIQSKKKIEVTVEEKKLCPRYVAKIVEGIEIGPSPKWMQERLEASGVRPINNIVDVTNYVMLEWGQPLHAFDFSKISNKIIVRKAKKEEKIVTLDGAERKLTNSDLVIADSKKPIAIAGVMGGANSEVDGKTKAIVLEAAVFEGTNVRKTAQRLGLRTEASNRFEKGVPLSLPELAIERAAGLLTEIAQENSPKTKLLVGENTDVLNEWIWIQHIGLPFNRVREFLGVEIPMFESLNILKSLGFTAEEFDFKTEARKHVGKPYVFGASFKTHGDMAFDCSYLTDYIYSQIGQFIGHTSLAQFEHGKPVENDDLKPGDILFVRGRIEKSVTDHYFVPKDHEGYEKITLDVPKEVGHNALYIGNGRIVHARHFKYNQKTGKWTKDGKAEVVEEDIKVFTENPEYLGARRYIDSDQKWIAATAPWWRLDVKIPEDLLEEIGRIYGFENIPGRLPEGKLPQPEKNQSIETAEKIRETLVGGGFSEVYNYSFVSANELKNTGENSSSALKIANPISPDQEYMRTSLVPSLLKNIATNQFNFESVKIYEIASIYLPQKGKELPEEVQMLGLAARIPTKKSGDGFFELKGAAELLMKKFHISGLKFKKEEISGANPGQAVSLTAGNKTLGRIWVPNAKTRSAFGIKTEVTIAILDPGVLFEVSKPIVYQPVSRHPQVKRDLNFIFKNDLAAAEIEAKLQELQRDFIKEIKIIDIYELSETEKSVTIRMVLASSEKTLTDEEIKKAEDQLILTSQKFLGGTLRK